MNVREIQKFYMIAREIHEHLACMQIIAEQNNIMVLGQPTLAEINYSIQQYHNTARKLEDQARKEEEILT